LAAFAGLEVCLSAGADMIVNTDADNQYCAEDIPKLIKPILLGRAEIVIGARPIWATAHFSPSKSCYKNWGVGWCGLPVIQISRRPSGFRAISRNAAMQMNVFNQYTYTLK